MTEKPAPYIGRFAPSPSGPLHFGSLVAALGSYLRARQHQGQWLLRIEDIDPPREQEGASDDIKRALEHHGMYWDAEVLMQSSRLQAYTQALEFLIEEQQAYYCQCTRAQLRAHSLDHPCKCKDRSDIAKNSSVRFFNQVGLRNFSDVLLGQVSVDEQHASQDFMIKRSDGLFAYQLAVVVDDIYQGITEVVRGADLLDTTTYQLALYQALVAQPPAFLHLPVVTNEQGNKLSKQNHAIGIEQSSPSLNLCAALAFLGLPTAQSLGKAKPQEIINWAIAHWHLDKVPKQTACIDNRIAGKESI